MKKFRLNFQSYLPVGESASRQLGGNTMLLTNQKARTLAARQLERIGPERLIALLAVLPPLIFLALVLLQHELT